MFSWRTIYRNHCVYGLSLVLLSAGVCRGEDWPMWRHDASRSAVTSAELPQSPQLQWSRELGTPVPAWPVEQDYQGKLDFDRSYQPIVLGKRIIVPSMVSDSLTAYDTRSGEELWRFYADGPIRFAPAGADGRVFFGSDDGHLYCLNAEDGRLLWKRRGGPDGRAVLGNQRLISSWPVRGAPVVADGRVYFGAGIWPFMGVFIHCVEAAAGDVVWTNGGTGAIYNLHQHGGADAFGGVAPQGYLAVAGDRLVVAGGLTVPAVFDRHTGEFMAFEQSHDTVGKGSGGFDVAARGELYFNSNKLFGLSDGKPRAELSSGLPLLADDQITVLRNNQLFRFGMRLDSREVNFKDRKGQPITQMRYSLTDARHTKLPKPASRLLLQAGSQLLVQLNENEIAALAFSGDAEDELQILWRQKVDGAIDHLLAADDRLFVVTTEGGLYCYGSVAANEEPRQIRLAAEPDPAATEPSDVWSTHAAEILDGREGLSGIALVWGLESGRLVDELLKRSNLFVIAVDDDSQRVDQLRRRLDAAQLYGRRVHCIHAAPHEFPFPPYLAELVVSERPEAFGWQAELEPGQTQSVLNRLFHTLRPYGGAAWLPVAESAQDQFAAQVSAANLPGGEVARSGKFATLTREGALPGAGQWTHQYASSGNTVFSSDKRVKAPLGLLWFGGPTNQDALPRHAQGPIPHVVGGRLIIEGVNSISARCVYTGRTLWRREFPDIGFPYKSINHAFSGALYIKNQPGANFIGSNYVSLADAIYVVYQNECHRLDPASGEVVATFRLPAVDGQDTRAGWGYIGVWGDYLIAGSSPQIFDNQRIGEKNWNATSSKFVVVMNRHTGDVLWTREATYGFRHNAIVPAGDNLFLIDRLSDGALKLMARRGRSSDDQPQLSAHDLKTGELIWTSSENIFGTWLGYSEQYDVLIQAGRTGGREPLSDEPSERIIAYQGGSGRVLWDEPTRYTGPLVILNDQVISSARMDGAVDLLTGQVRQRLHPVTGQQLPWSHTRTYGCGSMLACENLLTFRSGAAGFFDIGNDGGTGNFGGFKAGCTPNLVPADGVLNAPDYTRTCSCSYQNQTSLALVHQPDLETWTYNTLPAPAEGEPVRRIGINLNAPGDRLAEDGTLWIEYPSIAGPSPDIPITLREETGNRMFRKHALQLEDSVDSSSAAAGAHRWVAASGIEGPVALELTLQSGPNPVEKAYKVRLHFVEPDNLEPGARVFDVSLQGERRETALDIAKLAGGSLRPLVREYSDVRVTGTLSVQLHASPDSRQPVLSGIEVLESTP